MRDGFKPNKIELTNVGDLNVNIVDSGCGSGKTSYAIQMMNEARLDERFIYITPFLAEVNRVKEQCNRKMFEPNNKNSDGSKLTSLKKLISEGKDIVSTHALFKNMDQELADLIQNGGYTLILDEVMQVVETIMISKCDWNMLINDKNLSVDADTKLVTWLKDDYTGTFTRLMEYSKTNNLYIHTRNSEENSKVTLLVWTFPVQAFQCFMDVYILTYMFAGQIQKYYFDMYGINYNMKCVIKENDRYELIDYSEDEDIKKRRRYKELITIYEGKLNNIGEKAYSLSATWLKNGLKNGNCKLLKNNTVNYFIHITSTPSRDNMWTTILGSEATTDCNGGKIKDEDKIKKALSGNGYSRGFVSVTARATNDYREKVNCAYLVNRFLNPMEQGFFSDKGITVDEDIWALGELIQWLFRSAIREDKEIKLYIPSKRMRELLIKWLDV